MSLDDRIDLAYQRARAVARAYGKFRALEYVGSGLTYVV